MVIIVLLCSRFCLVFGQDDCEGGSLVSEPVDVSMHGVGGSGTRL